MIMNPDTHADLSQKNIYVDDCTSVIPKLNDESAILAITRIDAYPDNTSQVDNLQEKFSMIQTIVSPGGHLFVSLPPIDEGEYTSTPFRFVGMMEDIGWKFCEDIIWDTRTDDMEGHPEYVFVFKNPADSESRNNIYWHRDTEEKESNEIDLSDYQGEKSKNVWRISRQSGEGLTEELIERIIELYSYKGDTVCAPLSGDFIVSQVAREMDRKSLCFGVDEQKVEQLVPSQ